MFRPASTNPRLIVSNVALTDESMISDCSSDICEIQHSAVQVLTEKILERFAEVGLVSPIQIDSRVFKAFSRETIVSTIIDVFKLSVAAASDKPQSSFDTALCLMNFAFTRLESKPLTSQFCWSLIDQLGLEAEESPFSRLILEIFASNSLIRVEIFLRCRARLLNSIIKHQISPSKDVQMVKEIAYFDDSSASLLSCETWITLNTEIFPSLPRQELLDLFIEEIKKTFTHKHNNKNSIQSSSSYQSDYIIKENNFSITALEYLRVAAVLTDFLENKRKKYEEIMKIYHAEAVLSFSDQQQSPLKQKQSFEKTFYRWGWPFFSQADFNPSLHKHANKLNTKHLRGKQQSTHQVINSSHSPPVNRNRGMQKHLQSSAQQQSHKPQHQNNSYNATSQFDKNNTQTKFSSPTKDFVKQTALLTPSKKTLDLSTPLTPYKSTLRPPKINN